MDSGHAGINVVAVVPDFDDLAVWQKKHGSRSLHLRYLSSAPTFGTFKEPIASESGFLVAGVADTVEITVSLLEAINGARRIENQGTIVGIVWNTIAIRVGGH